MGTPPVCGPSPLWDPAETLHHPRTSWGPAGLLNLGKGRRAAPRSSAWEDFTEGSVLSYVGLKPQITWPWGWLYPHCFDYGGRGLDRQL